VQVTDSRQAKDRWEQLSHLAGVDLDSPTAVTYEGRSSTRGIFGTGGDAGHFPAARDRHLRRRDPGYLTVSCGTAWDVHVPFTITTITLPWRFALLAPWSAFWLFSKEEADR